MINRRLMAQIADTEWAILECQFQNAAMLGRIEPPAILSTGEQPAAAPQERRLVSLATRFERTYWMMTFRATEAELREAIIRVGNSAAALRRHFGR